MRIWVIAVLLCGCAWGQDSPMPFRDKNLGQMGCYFDNGVRADGWHIKQVIADGCFYPSSGDYGQTCGFYYKCEKHNPYKIVAPEPLPKIDIPAAMVDYVTHKAGDGYAGNGMWITPSSDMTEKREGCTDPDRILIGPDGHGKYWCHLPQQ
jgi:hypothetical protein